VIRGPLPALRHGPHQLNQRLLLAALDDALDQVEGLFLDDIPEVPLLLGEQIRRVVETVDTRLGYQVDQMGASPGALQGIIFDAEALVMKRRLRR
jgi:hypothetical protein